MRHTNGYEQSLAWVRFAKGEISRDEYQEGTEKPYSSKSILEQRKANRSRYETAGLKVTRTIRLK